MLASGNIRTGRAVFSLAAVNYNAAAHSRTLFPVISSVTVPSRRRGVCAGRNRCTGCNDFSTAETLCVTGIAVNLILVVGFTCIYDRCTTHMGVCILVAQESVRIVVFHISAVSAGIVVHRFVTAVSGSFQRFRFLHFSSIAVVCKVEKRNLINFDIGCVEKLSAIVAFLVLVPTFYCTGRVLCRHGGFVRMCARCICNRYNAGGRLAARLCSDGCRTHSNSSNLTGVVNRCNSCVAGCPSYGIGGIGRCYCRFRLQRH